MSDFDVVPSVKVRTDTLSVKITNLPSLAIATMTVNQGFMSPSPYGPANLFAQAGSRKISKNNFGSSTHTIEPQQTEKYTPRGGNLDPLNTDEASFFDFEPPSGTPSPYQQQFSTPGTSGMQWATDMNFHPISPPNSAAFTPKDWPYNTFQQPIPSNILTNIDPNNTRTQYGQVTPPDDDNDNESLLEQYQQRQMQPPESGKKRKRNITIPNENETPTTKRSRKYAMRGSLNNTEPNKPEDVKRSKFLERNRVAASKCRQKKKEWTQNLENRARELQRANSALRMEVDSCRQEILFLKGEMLKHSTCGCDQIQEFMKSGTHNFADPPSDEMIFKREQSPIESMPRSRMGSVSAASHHGLDSFDEGTSPAAEQTHSAIVNDEHALEALLSSSINHNTSDEGIASQVAR